MRKDNDNLCYRLSRWHKWKYEDVRDFIDAVQDVEDQGTKKVPGWHRYQREVFGRLFGDPEEIPTDERHEAAAWASDLHAKAEEVPEWKRLRSGARGNEMWAGIGTAAICEQVMTVLPDPPEEMEDQQSLERALAGLESLQKQGIDCSDEIQNMQDRLNKSKQAMQQWQQGFDESAIRQAVRVAVEQAEQQQQEAQQAMDAFGPPGTRPEDHRTGMSWKDKMNLVKTAKTSQKLKRIAKEAGRMKSAAQSVRRTRAKQEKTEVIGIEQGDDLARVLPAEVMYATERTTEAAFFQRWQERALLQVKKAGYQRKQRGPIVVVIDESGSMSGDKEVWAKATALALLDVAVKERRSFAIVKFDTRVFESALFPIRKGESVDTRRVMDLMRSFAGGGTSYSKALDEATKLIQADGGFKDADMIVIGDGLDNLDSTWVARHKKVKEEFGWKTYGILIGASPGALADFADDVIRLDDLRSDEHKAIELIFEEV